jgi:hypothetical protein
MHPATLHLSQIVTHGSWQPRDIVSMDVIEEYAAAMVAGDKFPPAVVFHDGEKYFMADGFHRYEAALTAGLTTIECDVRPGDKRAAMLYSVGANTDHGFQRSIADKRRAALVLLSDPEWSGWSLSKIADTCKVSRNLVRNVAKENGLTCPWTGEEITYTTKHGTAATMSLKNMPGRPPEPEIQREIDSENAEPWEPQPKAMREKYVRDWDDATLVEVPPSAQDASDDDAPRYVPPVESDEPAASRTSAVVNVTSAVTTPSVAVQPTCEEPLAKQFMAASSALINLTNRISEAGLSKSDRGKVVAEIDVLINHLAATGMGLE